VSPLQISSDLAFLRPLWLLVCLALIVVTILWRTSLSSTHWRKVIAKPVLNFLKSGSGRAKRIDLALMSAAIVALALSEPSVREYSSDTWRHSVGWIAVADVSRSMTLDDVAPNRMAAQRTALQALSDAAGTRSIALILFSGDAFLVVPPAFDRTIFNEHIARLEHGVIPVQGSNVARALSLASSVVSDSGILQARIFLLGDSGGTNRQSLAAARYLSESGHRLDLLLFGKNDPLAEQPLDMPGAQKLAEEGGGMAVQSNSLGVIPLEQLQLSNGGDTESAGALQSLIWTSQSHWLLLLLLPIVLLMFRQRFEQ